MLNNGMKKYHLRLVVVVYTCNSSTTWEAGRKDGQFEAIQNEFKANLDYIQSKTLSQNKHIFKSWEWWCLPVIPVFEVLRQEFEDNIGYIVRPCHKKKKLKIPHREFKNPWGIIA
jgi:hypothetical protein